MKKKKNKQEKIEERFKVLYFIQIALGIVMGLTTKVLEIITIGSIESLFSILNLISLLLLIQGLFNFIEDKYGIRVIPFNIIPSKKILNYK